MILSEIREGIPCRETVCGVIFDRTYDVVVCGLGTAGALAALFSAEDGLSVLGIEQFTCLGGTHTAGGVNHPYFGCPGGRYEAIDREVAAFAQQSCCTPAESRKLILEKALTDRGVDILYETSVIGVYLEEQTVMGIRIVTDAGILNIGTKILMDCTAEAAAAHMAGCPTEYGRKTDGQTQPYSTVSLVFDGTKYRFTNVDFGRVDQLDHRALSEALIFSRANEMAEERQDRRFIAYRPLLGLREGRRILPEEGVSVTDLLADRQTDTPMFFSYADLDKHGWDIAFDGEALGDWAIGANLGAYNLTVAVPYRAILPKGYDGILVPCRALGVDRDVSSCVRMLYDMKKLAEAAAVWAGLAIRQNRTLREVPYGELREKLIQSGCLDLKYDRGYRIDGTRNWDGSPLVPEDVHWIADPALLEDRLKTEKPGLAIWSAKRMGPKAIPVLRELLTARDENTAKHAAFALAMLQDRESIPALREMVRSRDPLMLKDCRKNNNLRGAMAIYWLGRLADPEITDTLTALICDEAEVLRPVYQSGTVTTRYRLHDFNDVYFQFLSQAVMALIRIGNAHPALRDPISRGLSEAFAGDGYYDRITKKPKKSSEGNMVLAMKQIAFAAAAKWNAVLTGESPAGIL